MKRYLIAGLGNPGPRYAKTRHNLGFMVVDALAERWGVSFHQNKWQSQIAEARFDDHQVLLVKPQTFMNRSGEALQQIVRFYQLPPEQVLIIFDDIDIRLGSIRMRAKGSAGTHNGMRSIVQCLQTSDFPRLKLSAGRRPAHMDLADFVLSTFTPQEQPLVEDEVAAACDAVHCWLSNGIVESMNRYNSWLSSHVKPPSLEEEQMEKLRAEQDAFTKTARRCGD